MIQLQGDTLPAEVQGAVVPAIWGDLVLDVPSTPVQVPWTAALADNCGAAETGGTLRISAPDIQSLLDSLTPRLPVVAAIDEEWVLVTSFLTNPVRMLVSRAYGGTVAAAHAKGATVTFLETRELHIFAWCPPGLRYPADAVVQLRIDNVAQVPPATIRLQDTRLVPGERFLTVEFDDSRTFGAITKAPSRGTTTQAATVTPTQPPPVAQPAPPPPQNLILRMGLAKGASPPSSSLHHDVFVPLPARSIAAPLASSPPPPTIPPPLPETPTAGGSSFRATGTTVGRLTADIKGLLDTPAGRYSGTGALPLTEPATITAARLEVLYGETAREASSWATTRAAHAALGITWRLLDYGEDFESFRQKTGFCGAGDLWLDDDGLWRYTMMDPNAAPVASLTEREIIEEPGLGFLPPSATRLEVAWGAGLQAGAFTLDSDTMIDRYDVIADKKLALPYLAEARGAQKIARRWHRRWDRPHATVTLAVSPGMAALTRTDKVYVATNLLSRYGTRRVPWEIRGTTDRGDQRTLVLVEGDATTLDLPCTFALGGGAHLVGLPLTFFVGS